MDGKERIWNSNKIYIRKKYCCFANEGSNKSKVITAFSSETVNGIKGYWVEP